MSAIVLIAILLACSGAWWLVNFKFAASIKQPFKFLINCVILAVAIYYTLLAFGVWPKIVGTKVPSI